MREKYIELIVEYIKQRPDYKTNLKEIKANVLSVGALEEEFHEAIRIILGLPTSKKQETAAKRLLKGLNANPDKLPDLTKLDLKSKKKYFTVAAVLVLILLFTSSGNKF